MEVNRLFRRMLLLQVLLGLVAFCIAAQAYGLMLLAGALVVASWYLVEGAPGRSLPHWATVLGATVAAAWLLLDLPDTRSGFVLGIGYFALALQILLIFSRKTNREYAMILILSVMQIIGASVLSVSIIYGLLLGVYCCLAILTILAFQIKSAGDSVQATTREGLPRHVSDPVIVPAAGRGLRWQFRITALTLGFACALVGAVVFVLAPRDATGSSPSSLLSDMRPREVGYTTSVDLTKPPEETASNTNPVAHLSLSFHGQPMQGGGNWRLRGAALDVYDIGKATWRRSQRIGGADDVHTNASRGIDLADVPEGAAIIDAKVLLRSNIDNTIFSLSPVVWFRAPQLENVVFSREDHRLSVRQRFALPLEYEFRALMTRAGQRAAIASPGGGPRAANASGRPGSGARPHPREFLDALRSGAASLAAQTGFFDPNDLTRGSGAEPAPGEPNPGSLDADAASAGEEYLRAWPVNTDQIRTFAQGILREANLERDPREISNPRDPECAQALMNYLRRNYEYSLTRPPLAADAEPITDFLFTNRKGHCELFASAMTAMARSLGMTARMVSGYLVNEYNEVGGYYVVRQSHAHTWTEVYCGKQGWVEFDATPGGSSVAPTTERSRFAPVRELYDHLEFFWISWVVAYDFRSRTELLQFMEKVSFGAIDWVGNTTYRFWHSLGTTFHIGGLSGKALVVAAMLLIVLLASMASLARVMILRRRRLKILDLRGIPRGQRPTLLRHIRFYIDTLELLERHGFTREPWQSPMNFADAVAAVAPDRLAPVTDLTAAFYELRFGGRPFDDSLQKRVTDQLRRLEAGLRATPPRPASG